MSIKIIEVKDRGVLNEGRCSNMGFAFLKKIKKDIYETVNPISPCKDYLNEVVFTENTGIGTHGCGLKYPTKNNIFDKNIAYIIITIQKDYKGLAYPYKIKNNFQEDVDNLKDQYKLIQALLNDFELRMGTDTKTSIEEANNGYYLVKVPIEWCKSTYSISLYTLLLRAGQVYDGKKNVIEFMESFDHELDKSLVSGALNKAKLILETKRFPELLEFVIKNFKENIYSTPHHMGIINWNSKYNEDKIESKLTKV